MDIFRLTCYTFFRHPMTDSCPDTHADKAEVIFMYHNPEHIFDINETTLEEFNTVGSPGFPFYAEKSMRSSYPMDSYPWHWHPTVQFFYVIEGQINYTLPNGSYIFKAGHGAFINSNILHMLKYPDEKPSSFIYLLFNPSLLGGGLQSDVMNRYVRPIIDNSDFDIFHLDPDNPKHVPILQMILALYDLYETKPKYYELCIVQNLCNLWGLFDQVSQNYRTNLIGKMSSTRIKAMITYMNEHYIEKITLDQIAEAGLCSKRECNRTFKQQLHTTPFEYLQQIRLQKACYYLVNTNHSVTDISVSCGFGGTSYFIKVFREQYGYSPKEYRNNFQTYTPANGQ